MGILSKQIDKSKTSLQLWLVDFVSIRFADIHISYIATLCEI